MAPVTPVTGCEAVAREIAKYEGWDHRTMLAIAKSENDTCDASRHNETSSETHRDYYGNVVCVGSYGVLQVGCVHYKAHEDRNDLATNVRIAHRVWQSQGYTAWTEYKNGGYRDHL